MIFVKVKLEALAVRRQSPRFGNSKYVAHETFYRTKVIRCDAKGCGLLTLIFRGAKDTRPCSSASKAIRSLTATIRSVALLWERVIGRMPTCITLRLPKEMLGSPEVVQSVIRL